MGAKVIENPAYREQMNVFMDRFQAGGLLAEKLQEYAGKKNTIVLAVPAGGVPVGYALAKELSVPMDLVVVRKIQIPWNTEAGFGAITWDDKIILNQAIVKHLNLTEEDMKTAILTAKRNIRERLKMFRNDKPMPQLTNKIVVLVDDG